MGLNRLTLAILGVVSAWSTAQAPLDVQPAPAPISAAAPDAARGLVYAIVPSRNTLLRQAGLGGPAHSVRLNMRPSGIAVSDDGTCIAVVSRESRRCALVDAASLTVTHIVETGELPSGVVALPDTRFAIANGFSDSITIISGKSGTVTATWATEGRVPTSLAVTDAGLAVGTRVPSAIHLHDLATGLQTATAPLSAAPRALAALDGSRVVAATGTELVLFRGSTLAPERRMASSAFDLAADGARLYALSPDGIAVFDADLNPLAPLHPPQPPSAITARDGVLVAAVPEVDEWYVWGLPQASAVAAEVPERPVVGSKPEIVEAQPIEQDATAAPAYTGQAAASPSAGQGTPAAPKLREHAGPVTTRQAPATGGPSGAAPVRQPAPAPDTPEADRRMQAPPARTPLLDIQQGGLTERIAEDGDFGAPGMQFERPDFTLMQEISAEGETTITADGWMNMEGPVHLSLKNTDFYADTFRYNLNTRDSEATGNVRIEQAASRVTASHLTYTLPLADELRLAPPLFEQVDEATPADDAVRTLAFGAVRAEDIEILEPTREFSADSLYYDFLTETGEASGVEGRSGEFYFGASRLRILGPASADGEDIWVTTCRTDPPAWRVRINKATITEGRTVVGEDARLQIAGLSTPVYWPRWSYGGGPSGQFSFDYDSGRKAQLGYFVNVGQRYAVSPRMDWGLRLFPTEKEGVGLGLEADYDYTKAPAHPLFLGEGSFRSLYTTEDRGYLDFYHRHKVYDDTILLARAEQWSDQDFYKDFYYERFRNRTEPRTYANITRTRPDYIATATVRKNTHGFVAETERLPEFTFHLLERELADNLYFSFDTVDGYNVREPSETHALRFANVARLTYDLDLAEGLNLAPFYEAEATWYSHDRNDGEADLRLSNTVGTTLQGRFHRAYDGAFGFSGFKHVVVPSVTYSYRPEPAMGVENSPRFDVLDNVYGRSRIESKIDNVFYGRDAESGEAWQVARLSLYQGNDFWNEIRKSDDYELELDLRPRPWWGVLTVVEKHNASEDTDIDAPFFLERAFLETFERVIGRPYDQEAIYKYNARYADYDRILSLFYYDDRSIGGNINGRLGFAYTRTLDEVFNREVLYGIGYEFTEKWSLGFEHRYDFEQNELTRQSYEIRRLMDCWEFAFSVTDRATGWDVGVELNVRAFPAAGIKF